MAGKADMTHKKTKMFRIEQVLDQEGMSARPKMHHDIETKIDRIEKRLSQLQSLYGVSEQNESVKSITVRDSDEESAINKMCYEIESIHTAIERTKEEISALHHGTRDNRNNNEAQSHLNALIEDTKSSTEKIINNTESIEHNAQLLIAALQDNVALQDLASDMLLNVTAIFEACGFHDLAGQRITRIVEVLQFTEEHIDNMMSIWGGVANMPKYKQKKERDELLCGPKTAHTEEHVTQDDIDALFN